MIHNEDCPKSLKSNIIGDCTCSKTNHRLSKKARQLIKEFEETVTDFELDHFSNVQSSEEVTAKYAKAKSKLCSYIWHLENGSKGSTK